MLFFQQTQLSQLLSSVFVNGVVETVGSTATLSDPKHNVSFPLKIVVLLLYLYHLLNREYLCHRMRLVHLVDLVSQEHTLLVSSLGEVLDLNYSLLHE